MKRTKRSGLALALALAILFCTACETSTVVTTAPETEPAATAETADDGSLRVIPNEPLGEGDAVNAKVRAYLDLAALRYSDGKATASVKTDDTLGSLTSSVRFTWTVKNGGELASAAVQYAEDPDFTEYSEVRSKRLDTGSVTASNIKTGTKYCWRVVMTLKNGETVCSDVYSFETKPGPRILSVGGVKNIRDLGGWMTDTGETVPCGRIFRSANFDHPDDDGKAYLLETLGIKTELDLRDPAGEAANPVLTSDLNYINIPIVSGYSYAKFFTNRPLAASIFRVFTKPENYPIDFHCAGGADRTGVVSFLLNALCGVSETDLICDYELTAERFLDGSHNPEHVFNFPGFLREFRSRPGETPREKARAFLIDECGMSEMEIANLVALRMTSHGVYADPPQKPIAARGGKITARIDLRDSAAVASVTDQSGAALPFTFESGLLTVAVSGSGSATVAFDDGGTLPILWS